MHTNEIIEREKGSLMPTYGRFSAALVGGKGAVATDAEGREYIDFGSGIGVNSLGYCDEGWVRAVSAQAASLQHISNLYYSPVQTELADTLVRRTGMGKAFLCNSGAEANECAIKLARKYSFDTYGAGRSTIVTLQNSFHGRTVTTLAATGQDSFHQHFFPFTEGFRYAEAGNLKELESKLDGTVCAVLLECIQGEGGVIPLAPGYLEAVGKLCKDNDILLLIDEVQTGIGRTGKLLCSEHYNVQPDVVTLAKGLGGGLPIGACLCAARLGNVLGPGMHGTTYGGNPVACAGALEVLRRVHDKLLCEVEQKGAYLKEQLLTMPHVTEVRGLGMMLGVVLDDRITAGEMAKICVQEGLLILTAKTLLRLLPPLTITQEEIDRGLHILRVCLETN